MEIKRLLYVTDLETPNHARIECLMELRHVGLEEIVILVADGALSWEEDRPPCDIRLKFSTGQGPLLSRITHTAIQESVTLIAANLKSCRGKGSGALALRSLLRSSPLPVIHMNENVRRAPVTGEGLFHHVVYATDWSPLSRRTLEYLVMNFRRVIKMLEIVHVVNKRLSVRDMRVLKKRLAETRKAFLGMGIDAESHIYAGKTADEILLAAQDYRATSIAMGTSAKSPFRAFFAGSCSYRVAEEADVPTLLVPLTRELGLPADPTQKG